MHVEDIPIMRLKRAPKRIAANIMPKHKAKAEQELKAGISMRPWTRCVQLTGTLWLADIGNGPEVVMERKG